MNDLDRLETRVLTLEIQQETLKGKLERYPFTPPVAGDVAERWVFNGRDWVTRYATVGGNPTYEVWVREQKNKMRQKTSDRYRNEHYIIYQEYLAALKEIEKFK